MSLNPFTASVKNEINAVHADVIQASATLNEGLSELQRLHNMDHNIFSIFLNPVLHKFILIAGTLAALGWGGVAGYTYWQGSKVPQTPRIEIRAIDSPRLSTKPFVLAFDAFNRNCAAKVYAVDEVTLETCKVLRDNLTVSLGYRISG